MGEGEIKRSNSGDIKRSDSGLDGGLHGLSKEELIELCSYDVNIEETLRALGTTRTEGLSSLEGHRRLKVYGENSLKKEAKMPLWALFLIQFANIIVIILLAAAIISILVGEWIEGVAVLVIILITAAVATFTEHSSSNALEALAQLTDPHTKIIRDGIVGVIRTPELVPGDIVQLVPGDLVPADVRILECHNLKVNEMILTGESADVTKSAVVPEGEDSKLTQVTMVYGSTSIVEGKVTGVVMLTGMETRVGSIAELLNENTDVDEGDVEDNIQASRHTVGDVEDEDELIFDDDEDEDEMITNDNVTVVDGEVPDRSMAGAAMSSLKGKIAFDVKNPFKAVSDFVDSFKPKKTPLQDELSRLGVVMTCFALSGAVLVIIIGIARNFRDPNQPDNPVWLQSLMLAVSMAVSAIPEGLPLVVVICLALGTKAMAKNHTLVRRLPAVETLGSASIICSDKTGTLTSGKMTAVNIWTWERNFNVTGEGYSPNHGSITSTADVKMSLDNYHQDTALAATMMGADLCNDSLIRCVDGVWKPLGTSTEASIVTVAEKFGLNTVELRDQHPRVLEVPFSSTFKMMATGHKMTETSNDIFKPKGEGDGDILVLAKGAPSVVLTHCTHLMDDKETAGTVREISAADQEIIYRSVDDLSSNGLRVLAVCYKRVKCLPASIEEDVNNEMNAGDKLQAAVCDMVFVGLIGMMDPPRVGVKKAIARAKRGGVRTVMITGDYLKTAVAIGKMIGLVEPAMDESESAMDCSALRPFGDYLLDREIDALTWHSFVFARARPEDKIQIVKSFQRQGFVCAMTGDGVNDAPALRQANIGVAMGIAGSEVAKAASDMILTDDKFSSIVLAIELGRTIYGNLRKFVMYLIGTNWSQVLVILVCVLVGMPSPLEPLQILFINLVTDGMPAIALSIEKPESDVMKEPPRRKNERILSGVIVTGILGHAVALVTCMLSSFVIGLWWNVGTVLLDNMYDENDDLVKECHRLNGDGTWETVHSGTCVQDGLKIARTMVFLTIALSETLRPLTARSFSNAIFEEMFGNPHLTFAIVFSTACTLLIVFVPGVNDIFHLTIPQWFEWLFIILGVLITIISDEILKTVFRENRLHNQRWKRLFTQLNGLSMELRNVRSHVSHVEDAACKSV